MSTRSLIHSSLFTFLLFFFASAAFAQTTISNGTTTNASSISDNSDIIINAGGTLNMNVAKTFKSITTVNAGTSTISGSALLTVTNAITIATQNTLVLNPNCTSGSLTSNWTSEQDAVLSGSGILTTGAFKVDGRSGKDGNFTIAAGSTVICTSINKADGNKEHNITVAGTLRFSGSQLVGIDHLTCNSGSTIEYNAAGNQNVFETNYSNLILSGSGNKSVEEDTSVANNLSISAICKLTPGKTISVGSLKLGAYGKNAGTWGSTSSAATFKNNTYFYANTGLVNVANDTRANLTITANNASKCYATEYALGTTAYTATGLINGDTVGSVTLSSAGAASSASAGLYSIVPSAAAGGTFATENYIIAYANGQLTVNTLPVMPLANTVIQPTCEVSTASVTLSNLPGGNWTVNPGNHNGTGNTKTISGLAAGTYNFTVTNYNGCVSPASADVVINPAPATPAIPTIGTVTQPSVNNANGSFVISNYNSAYTYTIYPSTGVNRTGDLVTAPAGTYTVIATSGNCTSAASASVTLSQYSTEEAGNWHGSVNTDWFEASNWTPAVVPSSNTNVVIPANKSVYITGANAIASAKTITVMNGGTLTVNDGTILNVTDAVTVNTGGALVLENNASLVQENSAAVNSGNIKVKRNTANIILNDYTYWSSPTNGTQTLQNFSPNSNLKYFLTYSNGWAYSNPAKTTFTPGVGYAILAPKGLSNSNAVSKEFQFTGKPNNGNISTAVVKSTDLAFSSKLIGNPYPSAIDADAFIEANIYDEVTNPNGTISGTLYFWTHNSKSNNGTYNPNNYATYNKSGGTRAAAASNGHANTKNPHEYIASCQGFIVETKKSGNVVFTNDMRVSGLTGLNGNNNGNANFYKNSNGKTSKKSLERNRIWLNFSNNGGTNFNQILVGYIETATNNFDAGFDGAYNSSINSGMYSLIGNDSYTIQAKALPFAQSDIVPLGYTTDIKGNSTISIDSMDGLFANGQAIYLEDKLLNVVHNLKAGAYTFATEAGSFNDRFVLKYANNTLGVNDVTATADEVTVTSANKQIKIQTENETIDQVAVYDITGKQMFLNAKVDSNETVVSGLNDQKFVIVNVVLANGKSVSKKVAY